MTEKLLYYVIPEESFEAEGRLFYKGEEYPVYEKDEDYVILVAENGDFCFSNRLMKQVPKEWGLIIKAAYLQKERWKDDNLSNSK